MQSKSHPFLLKLGRNIRTNEKKMEKIAALEKDIKNNGKKADENQQAMLNGKDNRVSEMKADREMAKNYIAANPDWNISEEELQARKDEEAKKVDDVVQDRLQAAFTMFANLYALNTVRDHVAANEDERAWLDAQLDSLSSLTSSSHVPESRTQFVQAMVSACSSSNSEMHAYLAKATSKQSLSKALKASDEHTKERRVEMKEEVEPVKTEVVSEEVKKEETHP